MVLVIVGILAVTAMPKLLNTSSSARIARLQAISASLDSAFVISFSDNVIHGRDQGHPANSESTYDLNNDGHNEYIYFGYPIIYDAQSLIDLIQFSECIKDNVNSELYGADSCSEPNFIGELEQVDGFFNTNFSLYDLSGPDPKGCKLVIENVRYNAKWEMTKPPNIIIESSTC